MRSRPARTAALAIALLGTFTHDVAAQSPAAPPEWKVDSARARTTLLEYEATEGTWISVDVSPDGRSIVFDLLGHLYEMPIAGGEARRLTEGRSWNMFPRYSPDGTRIAFTSDRSGANALWVLKRGSDSLQRITKLDLPTFQGTWSRDGRHIFGTALDLGARTKAYQFNLLGGNQELMHTPVFAPATQFQEHPSNGLIYYSQAAGGNLFNAGQRIHTYNAKTSRTEIYLQRPGGAANATLSRDGKRLAYVHRDDKETVLVVHEVDGRAERVLVRTLDRDRQESGAGQTYGVYPNLSWNADGTEIFVSFGGGIHAVNAQTGAARRIPFRARVRRQLDQTIRFPVPVPVDGKVRTRSHRWGVRTERGVVFEALGDLYLKTASGVTNLTNTPGHETNPIYHAPTRTLYYASWSDDDLGAVHSRALDGGTPTKLTTTPSQYGSLALSSDGRTLAFLRGAGSILTGQKLEEQGNFELVVLGADRAERKVTDVTWGEGQFANFAAKRPPGVTFSPTGDRLYFSEFVGDSLALKRVRLDGSEEETLYYFPHATRAVVSPDLKWIAFREYLRTYVTPFDFLGKPVTVSAFDNMGVSRRVDREDGDFTEWTADGTGLYWTRGVAFYEKSLADVLAEKGGASPKKTELAFEYDVDVPQSTIALTNARVVTMNQGTQVLENATVLVRRNRIEAVGTGVRVPADAKVYDLAGRTIVPGFIDAHAHYNPDVSALNVVEQRHEGLLSPLAYGVTTMYEVYGTAQKDFLVSDLQRKGAIAGARLFSVGPPIYGLRYFRPKLYRPIKSFADAEEIVLYNKDHGATALKDYVQFTRAARQQLYAAARKHGLNVVAETAVDPQMNMTQLIDGVSGLEHTPGITPMYDDVRRLLTATNAGITGTLLVVYNGPVGESVFHQAERVWEDEKLLRFRRREDLLRLRRPTHYFPDDVYAPDMAKSLHSLYKAGVPLQIGGHGQMYGLDFNWEMELFTKGGFTPQEVLQMATIGGAKYLGLDQQLGSIEVGKLADLVVLRANPLENIRHTRDIEFVMQNGVLYNGADAARVHPNPGPAPVMYFLKQR